MDLESVLMLVNCLGLKMEMVTMTVLLTAHERESLRL